MPPFLSSYNYRESKFFILVNWYIVKPSQLNLKTLPVISKSDSFVKCNKGLTGLLDSRDCIFPLTCLKYSFPCGLVNDALPSFRPLLRGHFLREGRRGRSIQSRTNSFVHFLFSPIASFFVTAHTSSWHYMFSCLFITDLLHLNVNSMGRNLELLPVYPWCLHGARGGSSELFTEWKKPFQKSSLQVNRRDHITSGSEKTSKKGSMLEWRGNWIGEQGTQHSPWLREPCHCGKVTPPPWNSFSSLQNERLWQDDFKKFLLTLRFPWFSNLICPLRKKTILHCSFSGHILLWKKKKNTIESCVFHKNCYLRRLYEVRKCHYKVKQMAAKGEMSKEYRERLDMLNEFQVRREIWRDSWSEEVPLTGVRGIGGQSTDGWKYGANNWENFKEILDFK